MHVDARGRYCGEAYAQHCDDAHLDSYFWQVVRVAQRCGDVEAELLAVLNRGVPKPNACRPALHHMPTGSRAAEDAAHHTTDSVFSFHEASDRGQLLSSNNSVVAADSWIS